MKKSASLVVRLLFLTAFLTVGLTATARRADHDIAERHRAELRAMYADFDREYSKPDNLAGVDAALNVILKKALEYGEIDYYFYYANQRAYYLISQNRLAEALDYLKDQQAFSQTHFSRYGVFASNYTLGVLYRIRGDFNLALRQYDKALAYARENDVFQESEVIYIEPCICYRMKMNYEQLLATANQGLKLHKSVQGRGGLIVNRCYALFALRRYEEFQKAYSDFDKLTTAEIGKVTSAAKAVKAFKQQIDGDKKKAEQTILSIGDDAEQHLAFIIYYTKEGQKEKVNYHHRLLLNALSCLKRSNIEKDMAVIATKIREGAAELEKKKADTRNTQLALQHTQLQLKNSNLELSQIQDMERLSKMTKERNALALRQQQLRENRMKDSLDDLQYREKSFHEENAQKRMVLLLVCASLTVMMLVVIIYFYYRNHLKRQLAETNRQLQKTHHELKTANQLALEADTQKSRFVQDISHEVRTPLNSIVGFSEVLTSMDNTLSEGEKTDLSRRITENSAVLSKLINDVLDLTSIESGRYEMKQEKVNVNALCREAVEHNRQLMADGVELRFSSSLADDVCVVADQVRMLQVLNNLLDNAAKFTDKGSVTLSCDLSDNQISIVVADTGIGIPAFCADEVFGRFRKLDMFKQGTGLGLYICRVIARKFGGDIRLDPNYQQGARFVFTLPCLV